KVNGTWEVAVSAGIDWVEVSPKTGEDNGTVNVTVHENLTYDSRSTNLSFRLNDELQEGVSFQIIQAGKERQVTYETILEENFDWLKSGNGVTVGSTVLYVTTDELRSTGWPESFKAHGWASAGTNRIYAREGLIKMGAAAESDFLVSPPLEFEGTKNLKIEFKAVPYITAGNNRDRGQIKVGTTQPGEVTVMPQGFSLDNWFDMVSDPQTTAIWNDPGTLYSFEVKGATSGIRIQIGSEGSNQRFFLDDIVVKVENE
ncbi:MAG TPA: BACON domain-containing protein, partial [Sphingobacterium sp.]|nr:BACON domain-containing protein [Sphingobacterium sp.]